MHFAVLTAKEDETLYGLWMDSDDRSQGKDTDAVLQDYYAAVGRQTRKVYPLFIVNTGYNARKGTFRLFVGGLQQASGLEPFVLPQGKWAMTTVPTRLKFLYGVIVGHIKRTFYRRWLPQSGYVARDITYECHDRAAPDQPLTVSLMFAIE